MNIISEQMALLKLIKEDIESRTTIENFIKISNSNFPKSNHKTIIATYSNSIFLNIEGLANHFDADVNNGITKEAVLLYFSLDNTLFPKLNHSAFDNPEYKFHFKDAMFNKNVSPFEFNGKHWERIFLEEHKAIIRFFENNLDFLPDSAKKYIASNIEQRNILPVDFPITRIKNDFDYKIFYTNLPEAFNSNSLTRFLKRHRTLNHGDTEIKTVLYILKAIEDKYDNTGGDRFINNFKKDLIEIIHKILNKYFRDFQDQERLIAFFKREPNICKSILLYCTPNDLWDYVVPVFVNILKDNESKAAIDTYFKTRLIHEQRDSSFFNFEELSEDKMSDLVEESKKQFINRYPHFA